MAFDFIEDAELKGKVAAEVETMTEGLKVELQKEFNKQIEGLKVNHDKLLDEKKKLQERFKDITDPTEALKALKLVTENEEVRLMAEGKFDEVIQKRLSNITIQHEEIVNDLRTKLEAGEMTATKYKSMYHDTIRDLEIREAAVRAKVLPEAIEDILNRGRHIFAVGEDERSVEARDANGKLRKTDDDKVLTVDLWIDGLKKQSPHYWPGSRSGGLYGGTGDANDLDAQIADAAKSGNTALFRKLRKKQAEMNSKK